MQIVLYKTSTWYITIFNKFICNYRYLCLITLLYKVEYCVFLSFQSPLVQKATRTRLKLKYIIVKVIDFANQNKIKVHLDV